ncbi:MAG: efflux RND transporter periplasmic adaptor subunit [Alphaproteobacteria bacterium]|nr:efflux RND transporter periplasmic adaptor subunit [Alphaproteobacteria bacterium]
MKNRLALLALLVSFVFLFGCDQPQEQQAGGWPTPEVTIMTPETRKVVEWDEFTGRFEPVEKVDVRARVSGYIQEIRFQDGQIVNAGDVLFVIDQRPYVIELQRTEAAYELARKEFERAEKLLKSKAIAQEDFDRRTQEFRIAKANLDQAALNVEFSEVKSPIKGRVGRNLVDVGNLISGGDVSATLLTTVVTTDPIHFYFEASEAQLLKYNRLSNDGTRLSSRDNPNPVFIKLMDEDQYTHKGVMDFVDNVIDQSTGTIQGRAIFDNKDNVIEPGMFARARVPGGGEADVTLVPDKIIGSMQTQKFVYVLDEQGSVAMKFVTLGSVLEDGMRVVRSGLVSTDKVIVDPLVGLQPGMKVNIKGTAPAESSSAPAGAPNAAPEEDKSAI